MNSFIQILANYTELNRYARHSEYWYFVLINLVISVFVYLTDARIGSIGILCIVYYFGFLFTDIAVVVRRFNNTIWSDWTTLLTLIPFVAIIIFLVFLAPDITPGVNVYDYIPNSSNLPLNVLNLHSKNINL